jgi:formate dehydrogenase major subunit
MAYRLSVLGPSGREIGEAYEQVAASFLHVVGRLGIRCPSPRRGIHFRAATNAPSRASGYILPPKGEDLMAKRNTRLTTPLVRDNGALRPATWDEALDRAAAGFRSAVEKKGGQTFGLFSCSKTTNEMNYLAQKFARAVVGSNNIDSCNRT